MPGKCWGEAREGYQNKGVMLNMRYHRPRKTYVVLEAPVDEDVNEFGLTWSPLMNRDLGGRASDKSQIVWLPVKRRQKTDVKCPKRG